LASGGDIFGKMKRGAMFQTFEVASRPEQGPPRLAQLRTHIAAEGLGIWLVPRADAWQGEYVAPCDARLAWLTGFTGSAGFAVITGHGAGVFVDGRYRVQVRAQVADVFSVVHWPEVQLADWLIGQCPSGGVIGFDPWLHTMAEVAILRARLAPRGFVLRAMDNLVDRIWTDRPAPPAAAFSLQPLAFAGETHEAKCARLAAGLAEAGQKAAVLTQPDSIAWLLNIRGADTPHNPVPQAYALLHDDGSCDLFARPGKAEGLAAALGDRVRLHLQDRFAQALATRGGPVLIDPKTTPQHLADVLTTAGVAMVEGADPCLLPKARKNPTEIAGMRAAQERDAVAMVEFLAWLDREAPRGGLTEIAVVRALEGFRRATNALRDISFETICGAGPHGAIVHYRVDEATNRPVRSGELLLVDSGGQYIDGTTDITRTVTVGAPPADARACYTRVLQGMIALSRARFPKGVGGQHLDALARFPLWCAGLDYDHGTGHGVGAYLSVHEGPQRISRTSDVALEPGMILSNEPGYYREGAFGIRIENLIAVREALPLPGGDARAMLDFETLTFVPLDRRLIDTALLAQSERDWIDAYHGATLQRVGDKVATETRDWLIAACAPL